MTSKYVRQCSARELVALMTTHLYVHFSSKSLARYMLQEKSKKWDKKVWKKEEVKVGVQLNNFCIVVK